MSNSRTNTRNNAANAAGSANATGNANQAGKANAPQGTSLQIGSLIDGKYKILNMIGKGGMSVVWLAMNERANKQWAIKEVRKDGVDNYEVVRQSLIAEVEYLKRLTHPNLPSIVDVIDASDTLLIVMDYVEGNSLSQALRDYGALPQEQVVSWAKQLCNVLGYLHSRTPAIIYRDLKPANIMLQPDGTVKIIDFGTAREFKEGRADDTIPLGTQGYAAPEQYGNHQTDARTDIYNLGATMYHLVTGHNPSEPPYVIHPIRQWNHTLSSGLEAIIIKCCQRDPNDRYQNMAELLYDLERYHQLDNEYLGRQRRNWRLFLASAITTVVFVVAAVGFGVAGNIVLRDSYDALISRGAATYGTNPTQAADYYRQAASIDPSNAQAYNDYLTLVKRDLNLSAAEHESLLKILNATAGGGVTNEAQLKERNPVGHAELAYNLGIAYYFTYEGNGNKLIAEPYLKAAAQASSLNDQQKALADALATIAGSYEQLVKPTGADTGKGGLINPETLTPREYWDTLVRISENENIAAINNTFVGICVYKGLIYEILQHGTVFSGVTLQEALTQLEKADKGLAALRSATTDSEELQAISDALALVSNARETATTTFTNRNFGSSSSSGSGGGSK